MAVIPEIINGFNVYNGADKLVGISGEVSLPEMEVMKTTISGAGLLGEYDAPNPGHFSAIDQELPFRVFYGDATKVINPLSKQLLTLRGSIQVSDGDGSKRYVGLRVVFGGTVNKVAPGTVKNGESMNAAITLGLTYIKIEVDNKPVIELDKLSGVYKVNGTDVLAAIKKLC